MDRHLEVELKWALTVESHAALGQRLAGLLGVPARLAQENRFFDTADRRLRAAAMNIRIRRENATVILTCKRRAGHQHPGLSSHDEWEAELPAGTIMPPVEMLPAPVRAAVAGAPLECLGGFANLRLAWTVSEAGRHELLCLDATSFTNRIDYELEIETDQPEASHAHWAQRLAVWGIPWQPQAKTKFARFLALQAAA
jgi:uncharacterized protein YjbK